MEPQPGHPASVQRTGGVPVIEKALVSSIYPQRDPPQDAGRMRRPWKVNQNPNLPPQTPCAGIRGWACYSRYRAVPPRERSGLGLPGSGRPRTVFHADAAYADAVLAAAAHADAAFADAAPTAAARVPNPLVKEGRDAPHARSARVPVPVTRTGGTLGRTSCPQHLDTHPLLRDGWDADNATRVPRAAHVSAHTEATNSPPAVVGHEPGRPPADCPTPVFWMGCWRGQPHAGVMDSARRR